MLDTQQLWQAVLGELELTISKANFITWFKNTSISSIENGKAIISVPNTFSETWIKTKFNDYILKTLKRLTQNEIKEIAYIVNQNSQNNTNTNTAKPKVKESQQIPKNYSSTLGINPKYVFENFVVGKSNELAHAACQAICKTPGKTYNPLFIYGGVGLGKTHLVQSVGNVLLKKNYKIIYASCEKFTNDYIEAVRTGKAKLFQNKYRNVDVLLIDDIQFITGKEGTQEAFFHTFNALHQNDKQIIITSDRPPKAIATLEDRLKSRFEWGMIAEILPPDLETRIAILQAKAMENNFNLENDLINYIASRITTNIRELEGALNTIIAHYKLNQIELTIESIEKILKKISSNNPPKNITVKDILELIASYYNTKIELILGTSRKREIVVPRQIAMYILRTELNYSYPLIGQEFGGRDHTTVIHACEKIEKELEYNERIKKDIKTLKQRLFK